MRALRSLLPFLFLVIPIGQASAQIDGAGTKIIIPLVASTVSFASEISLKDESGTSNTVTMQFVEGLSSASPGVKACGSVPLAAFEVKTVTLASQCALGAGGHFGYVLLTSSAPSKWFFAYSRTSNPQGIGFSVEGYPIGHIGGGDPFSEVGGIKRKAATATLPAFQSNCFVATLDDPVDYEISVDDANGSGTVAGTLGPFQLQRYLDIYAAAGAPAGDHDNTTVTIAKTDPSQFPNTLIAFCTVQDNTSFGADFRIAKTLNEADPGKFRLNCFGVSFSAAPGACAGADSLQPSAPQVPNATTKIRMLTRIHAPDTINCAIVSNSANLEIRLVRDSDGAVVAGPSTTSVTWNTGKRSAIGAGFHQYYWLEVGAQTATGVAIPFGIQCTSGNGMADPLDVQSVTDDF